MVAPNPPGSLLLGGVPERPNGAVLKTAVAQATVGSNPTPSAMWCRGNVGDRLSVRRVSDLVELDGHPASNEVGSGHGVMEPVGAQWFDTTESLQW